MPLHPWVILPYYAAAGFKVLGLRAGAVLTCSGLTAIRFVFQVLWVIALPTSVFKL